MSTPGFHPDSGTAYHRVELAAEPAVRVHDLAMIEFEGPEAGVAEVFFSRFGLQCSKAEDGSLLFAA